MNDRVSQLEAASPRLALGTFVLDPQAGELLTSDGRMVRLRRQALDVLLVLGTRPGQVVTRDELMRRIWPDVVVGDGSLNQAIAEIRRALGDQAHEIVRNVARRGYVLVPAAPRSPAVFEAGSPTAVEPASRARPPVAWALLALVLIMAIAAWVVRSGGPERWLTPANAMRAALPAEAPALSIAVLPLKVEGSAGDVDWMAEALHGDLIAELGRSPDTWVIARDTMASFKDGAHDPRRVARELGVRHVVRGSLRREGDTIRLSLALVDGDQGVQRWSDTFVTPRAALPQTLGDLAVQIERALLPEVFRARATQRAALSVDQMSADDLAMRGMAYWYRGLSRENVVEGLALLERAVALDPASVRAWGAISAMTIHGLLNGWVADRGLAMQRLAEVTARLDTLDREGQATYNVKAVNAYLAGDVGAMLRVTSGWVERHRTPWALGAHGFALMANGRFDESAQALERALRLSPRDTLRADWQYRLAMAHFGAGRWTLAQEWGEAAAVTNAALRWPPVHVAALWHLGQEEAARRAMAAFSARHGVVTAEQLRRRLPGDEPRFAQARVRLAAALAAAGRAAQE